MFLIEVDVDVENFQESDERRWPRFVCHKKFGSARAGANYRLLPLNPGATTNACLCKRAGIALVYGYTHIIHVSQLQSTMDTYRDSSDPGHKSRLGTEYSQRTTSYS